MAREILCVGDLAPAGFCLDVNGQLTPALPSTDISITDGTTTETVAAGDTITFTANGGAAGPLSATVSATDTVDVSLCLSTDAGNTLVIGTDGCLMSTVNVVTNAVWDDATNTINITFSDGSTVAVPIIDNIGTWISDFTISDGTNTDVVNNHETLTFNTSTDGLDIVVSGNQVDIDFDCTEALDVTAFAAC